MRWLCGLVVGSMMGKGRVSSLPPFKLLLTHGVEERMISCTRW